MRYFSAVRKKDPYTVLGVSKSASQKDIRDAYIEKSKLCHPDTSTTHNSGEEFAELAEAYKILSDKTRRTNYDNECFKKENQGRPNRNYEGHSRRGPYGGYSSSNHNKKRPMPNDKGDNPTIDGDGMDILMDDAIFTIIMLIWFISILSSIRGSRTKFYENQYTQSESPRERQLHDDHVIVSDQNMRPEHGKKSKNAKQATEDEQ